MFPSLASTGDVATPNKSLVNPDAGTPGTGKVEEASKLITRNRRRASTTATAIMASHPHTSDDIVTSTGDTTKMNNITADSTSTWYSAYFEDLFYFWMWILWLFTGTVFYAYQEDDMEEEIGWAKGFYMAVNIGYSIGWGYPPEMTDDSRWFSTIFVIIGASFVGLALGFFADKVVEDRDNWFANAEQKETYDKQQEGNVIQRLYSYIIFEWEKFQSLFIWFLWILVMTVFALCPPIDFPLDQAVYFAVSSCSTGGHWAIPYDSDNWVYGLVGFFAAIGVPLMGIAMGSLASLLISGNDLEDARKTIEEPVTSEEIDMLVKFNLANNDGVIDKSEFIIMCMVRTGTDPGLVDLIAKRFEKLDEDKSGSLTLEEIMEKHDSPALVAPSSASANHSPSGTSTAAVNLEMV